MGRPIYETEATRLAEAEVAKFVQQRWSGEVVKTPNLARIDWRLDKDGVTQGWAEFKRRYNSKIKYPTYMISLSKIEAGLATGLPYLIVVRWDDDIAWIRGDKTPHTVSMGGRWDRNDPLDIEKVAHFSIKAFTSFK